MGNTSSQDQTTVSGTTGNQQQVQTGQGGAGNTKIKDVVSLVGIIGIAAGIPAAVLVSLQELILTNIPLTIILVAAYEIIVFICGLAAKLYSRIENRILNWIYDGLFTLDFLKLIEDGSGQFFSTITLCSGNHEDYV